MKTNRQSNLIRAFLILSNCLFFAAGLFGAKRERVVISASASPEYVNAISDRDVQTYHFYEGQYYGGDRRDTGLGRTEFMEVAKIVAEALAEQNFLPEQDKSKGDLLIMITWGTTTPEIDWTEAQGITDYEFTNEGAANDDPTESGESSAGGLNAPSLASEPNIVNLDGGSYQTQLNRKLLGYTKDLGIEDSLAARHEAERLKNDLHEYRYFIALTAFDLPKMREENEIEVVWTTRYSIQSRGTNFPQALVTLNNAAKGSFGIDLATLQVKRVDKEGKTEASELEVIGVVDDDG